MLKHDALIGVLKHKLGEPLARGGQNNLPAIVAIARRRQLEVLLRRLPRTTKPQVNSHVMHTASSIVTQQHANFARHACAQGIKPSHFDIPPQTS